MMQAGVRLRQDTETTLPELPEQHRIREKEEELHGLESVHMAESETKCTAPGLNTLEPECVRAQSGVSDVHHTHVSLIKSESDLGSSQSGDLKTESLDSTELGYVTHLHPDLIKAETDDGGYYKSESVGDLQNIKYDIKSDQMKFNEGLVDNLMGTERNGAIADNKDKTQQWQFEADLNRNCKEEEIHDLTNCGDFNHHCGKNGEISLSKLIQERIHRRKLLVVIEPLRINSNKNESPLNLVKGKSVARSKSEIQAVEKLHRCIWCKKCFCSDTALRAHLSNHVKPYKCIHCEKSFYIKSHLTSHCRVHTGEKPYKCSHCGKCFAQKSTLNVHILVHTSEKPFTCTQCGKCFKKNCNLRSHYRVHTGEKPFRCSHCEKCFSRKCNLNVHRLVHTGEKPHKCTQCGKCFVIKSNFIRHNRTHTGEKPHKCSHCGRGFAQQPLLVRHIRWHTGEKPYKCAQCEKCFYSRSNLDSHRRTHTGEKPYKCSYCGKGFTRRGSLTSHELAHSDESPTNGPSLRNVLHGQVV